MIGKSTDEIVITPEIIRAEVSAWWEDIENNGMEHSVVLIYIAMERARKGISGKQEETVSQ